MSARNTKILFMDDENSIRELAKEYFLGSGYEIVAVKTGLEALTEYNKAVKTGHPFHIVVLDIVIPGGMGGVETMQNLCEIHPGLKGIAISGYAEPSSIPYYKSFFTRFMAKPFTMNQLNAVIDELAAQSS